LATNNLITSQGRASLAAGAILAVAGTLPSLLIFALHRWKMRVYLAFGNQSLSRTTTRTTHQFSLQMLLILTAAFALTGVVARAAITAVPDPFGTDRDILVLHVWLGFFPCLVATPTLLVTFRPSWKILLAVGFFLVVTLVEPLLLGLVGPIIFDSMDLIQVTSWDWFRELGTESLVWHGQAVIAVVIYALLARAAGIRMFVSRQSNDKNPNPSGEPATDAGCVQD
jgi:hypothetical protein